MKGKSIQNTIAPKLQNAPSCQHFFFIYVYCALLYTIVFPFFVGTNKKKNYSLQSFRKYFFIFLLKTCLTFFYMFLQWTCPPRKEILFLIGGSPIVTREFTKRVRCLSCLCAEGYIDTVYCVITSLEPSFCEFPCSFYFQDRKSQELDGHALGPSRCNSMKNLS